MRLPTPIRSVANSSPSCLLPLLVQSLRFCYPAYPYPYPYPYLCHSQHARLCSTAIDPEMSSSDKGPGDKPAAAAAATKKKAGAGAGVKKELKILMLHGMSSVL